VTHQLASFLERNSLGPELSIFLFSFFFLRIGLCKVEPDSLSSFISQAARNPLGVLPDQIAIPVSEIVRLFIGAHTETLSSKTAKNLPTRKSNPEPTGFPYLFVIYGFSIAETDNLGTLILLGRAPEANQLEPFLTFGSSCAGFLLTVYTCLG